MSHSEYLNSFRYGRPCSRVIVIPGISGVKLRLRVNCEDLHTQRSEVFASCYWTICSNKSIFDRLNIRLKEEYGIWIPDFNSPLSSVNFNSKTKSCFEMMMSLAWDTANKRINSQSAVGIDVIPYGMTE